MGSILVIFLIFGILSVCIICSDVQTRTIPHYLIIGLLITSILNAWVHNFLAQSVFSALVVFVIFFSLWLFGFIGGGDVKLISVFVVGIAPQFTVLTVCMVGILGGLQLGVAYMLQQQPFSRGVPYGVPIVLSGLAFTFLSNYSLVKYVV